MRLKITTISTLRKSAPQFAEGRTIGAALRDFGFTKAEVARVLPDLQCGRPVRIADMGFDFHIELDNG